jgi:hypothetical protein
MKVRNKHMFGQNESQKKLYEEWDNMDKDEKWDTFLKKVSWWHSHIHIPGTPPHEAINKLANVVEEAAQSSDRLTKSIRTATWVGGIAAAAGVLISLYKLFI